MSTYREGCLRAKAARRDPAGADTLVRGRPQKAKGNFTVECRGALLTRKREWHAWRSYRTLEAATGALSGFQRKYSFWEWRIQPMKESA